MNMSYKIKKAASVAGLASMAALIVPSSALAYGQMTVRNVTLGTSKVDAFTTLDFNFSSATAATLKGIKIEVCTLPAPSSTCVVPTNASLAGVSLTGTDGELSGWTLGTAAAGSVYLTNASGDAVTAGANSGIQLAGFRNPTDYGTFYFRISTYTTEVELDMDDDTVVDRGSVATSTAKSITVTADVAETLIFRVANQVANDCTSQTDIDDPNDTTEDLVTLTPNPMSLSQASTGTAQFCIVTNAQNGYTVTYQDELGSDNHYGYWNGAHQFPVVDNFTSTPGTEQFGFNLRDNATPNVGADPAGAGLVADLTNAEYNVVDQYSYNDTGATEILAQKTAPSASAVYTISYVANIDELTPAGTYQAHQIFVATASF